MKVKENCFRPKKTPWVKHTTLRQHIHTIPRMLEEVGSIDLFLNSLQLITLLPTATPHLRLSTLSTLSTPLPPPRSSLSYPYIIKNYPLL
jgi:hypothetical protein